MNRSSTLLIANGEISNFEWLKIEAARAKSVIVIDGGSRHAFSAGIVPDLVIGDIDSTSAELLAWLKDNDVAIERFSAEKDQTDLELGLAYAVNQTQQPIAIAGALGGRVDHLLANILLLADPRWIERPICLIEPNQQLFLLQGENEIIGRKGDTISFLPLDNQVRITAATGLKWPLDNMHLKFASPRGISNIIIAERLEIKKRSGTCACIVTQLG